jgi:carotenoid cleavage dioxygenase
MNRREYLQLVAASGAAAALPWSRLARAGEPPPSPFLSGNFAPVLQELTVDDLEIEGTLPAQLAGTYLRNGPNPVYPPVPYHIFDGDGMLHEVRLTGGTARYRNRFVQTEGLRRELQAQRSLYNSLFVGPPVKNTANTALLWHHDRLLALWEGGLPHLIQREDLSTVGLYDFSGSVGSYPFTAHPKVDPHTGELVSIGLLAGSRSLEVRVHDARGAL